MHTIDKGEIARYLAIVLLMKKDAIVSIPTSENCSYDLVVDYQGKLYRAQVKKLIPQDNGTLKLPACSNIHKNGKWTDVKYTSLDIDWLLGVDIDNSKLYRMDYTTGKFDGFSGFLLRLEPAKNNNTVRIRFAKDYEF
jgi:hypothetical protein